MSAPSNTRGEETASQVTHAVGAALGVAGTVLLVVVARRYGDAWHVVSSAIFGAVVIMVIITTLITPLALKWALDRKRTRKREG